MYIATLTNQGQITVPSEVRKLAGLVPGDKVVFVPESNTKSRFKMEKMGDWEELKGVLSKYKGRYPTQGQIAEAWSADYAKKWMKYGKSSR